MRGAPHQIEPLSTPLADRAPGSKRFRRQRERILDAATILMNQRGVLGMTLVDVAQALDLSTTSVTYYFRFKEQLAAAVFEESLARLEAMVREAALEPTPKTRVARYIQLHFDLNARALLGEVRPLAILSEIRALEESTRAPLIAQYQTVFRGVRDFFGPWVDEARKLVLTGRAHMLNEALFWSVIWLSNYAISDFDNVRRRMFSILEHGIAAPGSMWTPVLVDPGDVAGEQAGYAAVLRVATRLINDIGYRGASIDRIMSELNLTKGSFYHHLDAKDDLVLQCFRHSYRRMMRIQHWLGEQCDTQWQRLTSGIASSLNIQFEGTHPLLRSSALQALPAPVRDIAVKWSNRTALRMTGLIVEGMVEGTVRAIDPIIASQMIVSSINSAYDIRGWASKQSRAQAIMTYASGLMSGIFDGEPHPV